MSYISTAIGEIMTRRNLSQSDIVRATGIDKATISRLINDGQVLISDEDLAALASLCSTDRERAELTAARMRDVGHGPGSNLIALSIGDEPLAFRDAAPASHPFERALQVIRAHHHIKEVREIVTSLGTLLETGKFEPPKIKYPISRKKKD